MKIIIALLMVHFFVVGGESLAQNCPDDFIERINGDNLTDLQKDNLGKSCSGRVFIVHGAVCNITKYDMYKDDSVSVVHINPSGVSRKTYQIQMQSMPGCDLGRVNKGDAVEIKGEFKRFLGFSNNYVEVVNGQCAK